VSSIEHKGHGPSSVACFALTVSDTRTEANDTGGQAIRELLERAGHGVSGHAIVRDEPSQVTAVVRERLADPATQVIITTGGTGISARDTTFEAVTALFDKRLDGFGELFRMISFSEIGSAAMMSRATAGTVGRKAIFVLPGSPAAVRLAMEKLIVPELGHIVQQLTKTTG
jgi:molybdenum cofactor biosynthesis protein B